MKGRLVILLAVVAAAVAIAGEAGVMPPQAGGAGTAAAPRTTVPVQRGLPPMVCPGPETLLAPAGANPVAPGGVVRLRALLAPDEAGGPADAAASLRPLAAGGGPIGGPLALRARNGEAGIAQGALDRSGATVLSVPVDAATPLPEVAAVQSTLDTTGDIRGLVATGCSAATSDLWLVGGGSSTGRRGRLLLTNPSTTSSVTVDVTVHGPSGVVPVAAGQGIVLPAGGQAALLLDALAPGLPAAVVHVHTRSGRVVGTLHDSLLRGLVPGGADDVPAATGPATQQVVAGLLVRTAGGVTSPAQTGSAPAGHSAAAGATAVRVAVAGRDEAIVRVRLLGPTGLMDLGAQGVATVPGGGVADIPITGVPNGVYAALVQADVPVVAGAIVGRASAGSTRAGTAQDPTGKAPPSEFAWAAASPPVSGTALAVLPPAAPAAPASGPAAPEVTGVLTLASVGGGTAVIRAISADGTVGPPTMLSVPAGSTLARRVRPGAAGLQLTGGPDVYAAMVLSTATGEPMISVLPLAPQPRPSGITPLAVENPGLGLGL